MIDGVGVLNGHKNKVIQAQGDNEESAQKLTEAEGQKLTPLEEEGLISIDLQATLRTWMFNIQGNDG